MLVVLNGAPGVGKSALADRYADDHPLALVIEIDDLRRRLGRWETTETSKLVARDLAVALALDHLRGGHDVIVPQFLGRREFVARLRAVADETGTRFIEVILTDDTDAIIERFRRRRAEFAASNVRHPEADLTDEAIAEAVRAADEGLRRDADAHGVPVIRTGAGIDTAYRALCAVISG